MGMKVVYKFKEYADWIEKNQHTFIEISDKIWNYAELGFQEYK